MSKKQFSMSPNMVFHLVFSQAGTIAKALAELAMNAHDAGATKFKISITPEGFVATDNGIGFRTAKEIEDYFSVLGFDHSDDLHQESHRYGAFGLGRAQCMAFAATQWHTNEFMLDVDIKARGLEFDVKEASESFQGCSITGRWYEPLTLMDIKQHIKELSDLVCYMSLRIYVNGKMINKSENWDLETDEVLVRRTDTSSLKVYNRGVLVKHFPAYQYGSGVVVSKTNFTLNIARNDILVSKCPVWKVASQFLKQDATERAATKTRLNEDECELVIDQFITNTSNYKALEAIGKLKVLEDVMGRRWQLNKLWGNLPITVKTRDTTKVQADALAQRKTCVVLSPRTMHAFGCDDITEMTEVVNETLRKCNYYQKMTGIDIDQLLEGISDDHQILGEKDLSKIERAGYKSLTSAWSGLLYSFAAVADDETILNRKLYIGKSEGAEAWTDGASYVVLNVETLRKHLKDGFRGFNYLANVLTHELCHNKSSMTDNNHDQPFYELFHDFMLSNAFSGYGTFIRQAFAAWVKYCEKMNVALHRNDLRDYDREIRFDKSFHGDSDFQGSIDAIDPE